MLLLLSYNCVIKHHGLVQKSLILLTYNIVFPYDFKLALNTEINLVDHTIQEIPHYF